MADHDLSCSFCGCTFTTEAWQVRRGRSFCSVECRGAAARQKTASRLPLTAEILRELVHYDPETGQFTRLVAFSPKTSVGDRVGSKDLHGYLVFSVYGKQLKSHRLAWLYMAGEWPKLFVDHINGDKTDNRWSNLRHATPQENTENTRKASKNSKSGLLGASKHSNANKWVAQIGINYKQINLGLFDTPEEAHAAYLEAKRILHKGNTL